jgi:hypothetical protein
MGVLGVPVSKPYRLPIGSGDWGSTYFDGLTGRIDCGNNVSMGFAAGSKISIFAWINVQTLIGEHAILGQTPFGGILFEQFGNQLSFWFNTNHGNFISTFPTE